MSSHSTITARLILCHGMTEHQEKKHGATAEANRQNGSPEDKIQKPRENSLPPKS